MGGAVDSVPLEVLILTQPPAHHVTEYPCDKRHKSPSPTPGCALSRLSVGGDPPPPLRTAATAPSEIFAGANPLSTRTCRDSALLLFSLSTRSSSASSWLRWAGIHHCRRRRMLSLYYAPLPSSLYAPIIATKDTLRLGDLRV